MVMRLLAVGCWLLAVVGCQTDKATVDQRHEAMAIAAYVTAFDSVAPLPVPDDDTDGVCPDCHGTGEVGDGVISVPCGRCGGDGRVQRRELRVERKQAAKPTRANKVVPRPAIAKQTTTVMPRAPGVRMECNNGTCRWVTPLPTRRTLFRRR